MGFGVLFLSMIVGTAVYAGMRWRVEALAGVLIAMHIAVQIAFTAGVHSAELVGPAGLGLAGRSVSGRGVPEEEERPWVEWAVRQVPLVSMAVGLLALLGVQWASAWLGGREGAFEWGYRVFMGFYGLVFPAYVLIAMVPTWGSPRRPTGAMVRAWVVGTLVAAASYLAFIVGEMWWVGPVMAVVAAATAIAWRAGVERPITLRDRPEEPR